jgi:MOSC domain-containing protein YiiM
MSDRHRSAEELDAGVDHVRSSPGDGGVVELVVRRPSEGQREILDVGELALDEGLVGDRWSKSLAPNPEAQLTLMNARATDLVAGTRERWPLAGDQLYVDLDLSVANLPAGTRLAIGSAVVEITAEPHTGCAKFTERFGPAAIRLVNQPPGRELRLRGANARVVEPGTVRPGDSVRKLPQGA